MAAAFHLATSRRARPDQGRTMRIHVLVVLAAVLAVVAAVASTSGACGWMRGAAEIAGDYARVASQGRGGIADAV
jgi:hypothetical protein